MRITAELLRSHRACTDQLALFEREFPDGMDTSEATLLRAVEVGLDLNWAACWLLPPLLRAEYQSQHAPLWAEYERQRAPLWAEYLRQCARMLAEIVKDLP
jgi:hypothetical protein